MKKIRELIEFKRSTDPTIKSLLEFIAKNTLDGFKVLTIFLAVVRSNGALYYPTAYGMNTDLLRNDPARFLDSHTPGYDAFVNGRVVECGNIDEYPVYFPENVPIIFPNGFDYSLAIPVPSFGTILVYCEKSSILEAEVENFLITIGEVIALQLQHGSHGLKFDVDAEMESPVKLLPLTSRQWLIRDAMLRGFTNGAIAKEMNFSESLIRHETIRIYSKLKIKGRRELIELADVHNKTRFQ